MLKLWNVFSDNCRIWKYFLNFPQGDFSNIPKQYGSDIHKFSKSVNIRGIPK